MAMPGHIGRGITAAPEGIDGLSIASHIGMIQIRQRLHCSLFSSNQRRTQLKLQILSSCTPQIEIEIDAIGHFGHQQLPKSDSPARRLVLEKRTVSVATSVGGVVIAAVVVDGPVGKLQMAVGSNLVYVKKIGGSEFSQAKFQSLFRQRSGECQEIPLSLDGS